MNGKFRTSISGFNRQDVLDYIKQLSEKNALTEKDNEALSDKLEQAEERISELEAELKSIHSSYMLKVNAVKDIVSETETAFNTLSAELANITKQADTIQIQLTDIKGRIDAFSDDSDAHDNI